VIAALLAVLSGQVLLDARPIGALVVVAPPGVAAPPRAALVEGLDAALRSATRLALRSEEQLGLDPTVLARCAEEDLLGCVARHVRARAAADALLLVGVAPLPSGRWRCALSILLFDDPHTRALLDAVVGRAARAAAADALFERSVRVEPQALDVVSADAVRAWVSAGLPRDRAGALAPAAALVVDVPAPSGPDDPALDLEVGGRSFTLTAGRARVDGLAAGPTRLRFVGAGAAVVQDVTLSAASPTIVAAPTRAVAPPPPEAAPRAWALGAGAGLAVGGLTLSAITLAAGGQVRALCLTRAPTDADCAGLGPAPLAVDGARLPALDAADVRAGPPGLLLGGALVGAGVTWLALELFARDEARPVWLDVLLVLGGGAAGAGLGYAASP
jgi:hypothetical protein